MALFITPHQLFYSSTPTLVGSDDEVLHLPLMHVILSFNYSKAHSSNGMSTNCCLLPMINRFVYVLLYSLPLQVHMTELLVRFHITQFGSLFRMVKTFTKVPLFPAFGGKYNTNRIRIIRCYSLVHHFAGFVIIRWILRATERTGFYLLQSTRIDAAIADHFTTAWVISCCIQFACFICSSWDSNETDRAVSEMYVFWLLE
mmetsp:Transcript_19598/g.30618  ORF Transcript_19598/g.30618 Transcript_19598/m.30618 type:complete len:201 (+) Transcript_19598:433-1035(+)